MTSTMLLAATLIGLVDTSHGRESAALRPVAARLVKARIPAENRGGFAGVVTMLQAVPAANILPDTAEATTNCRLLPDENSMSSVTSSSRSSTIRRSRCESSTTRSSPRSRRSMAR